MRVTLLAAAALVAGAMLRNSPGAAPGPQPSEPDSTLVLTGGRYLDVRSRPGGWFPWR